MGHYTIYPIPLFQSDGDMSRITYRSNIGSPCALVNYVWYISGANNKVLVDAGGSSEFFLKLRQTPAEQIQTLDEGLSKLGITANDIDLVILTHLHHDHIAHASCFPQAKVLVQKDELSFSQNPHPLFADTYNERMLNGLDFEIVDGDIEISEDLSVIKTPGHTPGGQSAVLKTLKGTAVISGLCTCAENFNPSTSLNQTLPVIIPTIHTDPLEAYDSMMRIKRLADIIVPCHDLKFRQIERIP